MKVTGEIAVFLKMNQNNVTESKFKMNTVIMDKMSQQEGLIIVVHVGCEQFRPAGLRRRNNFVSL